MTYYYKIIFSPKKNRVCCLMQIIEQHREIFNIPFHKVSALVIDNIPIMAIYFLEKITHQEYLEFIFILKNIVDLNNIKFRFVKSYVENIYEGLLE